MRKIVFLALACVIFASGCNSVALMFGADVVTDNLREADSIRHKWTLVYIAETVPMISESELPDEKKAELLDMGKKLAAISEKENKLIVGEE